MHYDTKLESKQKELYQITQVLDKEAYKIALDEKKLPKTVNKNLLKKYYRQSHYELVIIIESDINRKHIGVGTAKINMLITEQILERISRNVKKNSKWNKQNYYQLGKRIKKLNKRVNIYLKQKVSAC